VIVNRDLILEPYRDKSMPKLKIDNVEDEKPVTLSINCRPEFIATWSRMQTC
jgi:hypothetical protein